MRNCLLENFQSSSIGTDKGELWENIVFKQLNEKYPIDFIHYRRTSSGQKVDFVLPGTNPPKAIETKFDKALIKKSKYRKFKETYPEILLKYIWMTPFDENFFRRLEC